MGDKLRKQSGIRDHFGEDSKSGINNEAHMIILIKSHDMH